MTRFRFLPAALFCACLSVLAACSSSPAEPTAAAASSAGASSAGASPAGAAVTTVVADKALCKTLNTAATALRTGITEAQQEGGGVKAADAKRTFIKFHTTVTEALAFAETSDVSTAAKAIADELDKAAKATDPISSAADSNFARLGTDLTEACKTAGVTVMF
ncbi:hypothetical protein FB565_007342 [Actinoplanes lutulentus]|uniref:hypothetical protein n=1 Tax=Actinoplanes lutulentus TaxID=1287878 RepID=UPI000DBA0A91|nr:hypothetical protein [Actinoplanes lutulentus]MBB2947571.1 hypothetical protein [Actinoplanes lutulentus]